MVATYWGTAPISSICRGSVRIAEVRRGSVLVWQRSVISDDFNRADADTTGANWTEHSTAVYKIGIEGGTARVKIPEGLLGGLFSLNISRQRFNVATSTADDGYIECGVASTGSPPPLGGGYYTDVLRRLSNSDFTDGVGIRLAAGSCSIMRRVSDVDTVMVACGEFQAGDVLRLNQVGNVHTLYRNGGRVGYWNDSGATAHKGAGYRSMGVRADGAKDLLGPRRFSPALDYVVMG